MGDGSAPTLHYSTAPLLQDPIYKPLGLAILPVPMTLLINILLGFYLFVAALMILVILMQRPKSEGLGAAFGGGVTENIFGAQTTNVLTKITGWLAATFFLLTFTLSILYAQKGNTKSGLGSELRKDLPPAPLASPTATPNPAITADASPTPGPSASATGSPGTVTSPTPTSSVTPAGSASPSAAPSATPQQRRRR
jgi:preprotein translocase subunit SecG